MIPRTQWRTGVSPVPCRTRFDPARDSSWPYAAGYAATFGLPHDEALNAITLNPAEIWGVADQFGFARWGKDGQRGGGRRRSAGRQDGCEKNFHRRASGSNVPMTSRQTELRDRYSGK